MLAPDWACYHTQLHVIDGDGIRYEMIGGVVGASFAVLVAKELFASGCRLLLSVTWAGQITDLRPLPYFVLIDRALRGEGTSYHYLAPDRFVAAEANLMEAAALSTPLPAPGTDRSSALPHHQSDGPGRP